MKKVTVLFAILFLFLAGFIVYAQSGSVPAGRLLETIVLNEAGNQALQQDEFSIISYNIGFASGVANQSTNTGEDISLTEDFMVGNLKTISEHLIDRKADVVAFQEVDIDAKRSFNTNQVFTLANASGYTQAIQAVNWDKRYVPFPGISPKDHFGKVVSGQATLTNWPILHTERIELERPKGLANDLFYLDRLAVVSTIDLGGTAVTIINVHLEHLDIELRRRQLISILEIYDFYNAKGPTLLVGDFNSVPYEEDILYEVDDAIGKFLTDRGLVEAFIDLPAETIYTYRTDAPDRKLDYIWYDPEKIEKVSARIHRIGVPSDHHPIEMTFKLR